MDHFSVAVGIDAKLTATLLTGPEDGQNAVAVVEHTLPPKTLAAPLHRHAHEDEISYVLEGTMGVEEDGEVSTVEAGEIAVKERGVWHTFWNPGTTELRFVEIIAPGSFAGYFADVAELLPIEGQPDEQTRQRMAELRDRYDLEMDPSSVPALRERHGLG